MDTTQTCPTCGGENALHYQASHGGYRCPECNSRPGDGVTHSSTNSVLTDAPDAPPCSYVVHCMDSDGYAFDVIISRAGSHQQAIALARTVVNARVRITGSDARIV
jgi:hypothetical protein